MYYRLMLSLEIKFYIIIFTFLLFAAGALIVRAFYSSKKKKSGVFLKLSVAVAVLGTAIILDMFFIEPNWIATEQVVIRDPQLAQVLAGLKVVQISDIHMTRIGFRERQLIEKVNALKPDLLFITGDFFRLEHARDGVNYFGAITDLIKSLKPSVGIFGILGNYDGYVSGNPDRIKELKLAGIDILYNESRKITLPNGNSLWLAGSYYDAYDYQERRLNKTLEEIPSDSTVILLNHYPDVFGRASMAGINLVLAGHTHGGQINIPFLIHMSNSANKSRYMKGLFESGKTKMYVNRGIGMTNIPVRFLCRPEITVFEFTAEKGM